MEHILDTPTRISAQPYADTSSPAYEAYRILHLAFVVAPIVAGLDKFFSFLVDWTQYLTPLVPTWTGIDPAIFMMVIGVVEIIAGILVAVRPKWGAWVVTAWLWGIIINLLLVPGYYDIALRDLGLSFGALALARLAEGED